jgi:hypothetical protein
MTCTFSNVLAIVTLYSKYTGALTLQNLPLGASRHDAAPARPHPPGKLCMFSSVFIFPRDVCMHHVCVCVCACVRVCVCACVRVCVCVNV